MSITLTSFRNIIDNRMGGSKNVVSSTTTAAGAASKLTAIDSALERYGDDYFKGWTFYITGVEGRLVKTFNAPDGVFTFYHAATSIVGSATAYVLSHYNMDDVKAAINQALVDIFPDDFYKRHWDTTLYGQGNYGKSPNEYNRYLYTVPSGFEEFPYAIWLLPSYIGDHTGSDDAATLTDSSASWTTSELVGFTVYNKTDGSSGTVTANTSTTITATLAGGTDTDWDENDEYIIQRPDTIPKLLKTYRQMDRSYAGVFTFYAYIPEDYIIALEGKQPLTQFTTEASTTELTEEQAHVVARKAIANFYRMYTININSQDYERFDAISNRFELEYIREATVNRMPSLWKPKVEWK